MRISGGAAATSPDPKLGAQLLTAQIRAIVRLVPALSGGAFVVSFLLLALTAGTSSSLFVFLWSTALHGLILINMRAWLRSKRQRRAATRKALTRAVVSNILYGVLWGILPVMLFTHDSSSVALTVALGTAGVLCASGLVFPILPRAAYALALPVLAGTLWTVLQSETTMQGGILLALFVTFIVVSAALSTMLGGRLEHRLGAELKMREQQNVISLLLKEHEENSSDWLWELDAEGRITRASSRFSAASGQPAEGIIGRNFYDFLRAASPENALLVGDIENHVASRATFRNAEITFRRDGEVRNWRLAGKPALDEFGRYVGYVGTASDVTAEKHAQRRIKFLAHNDALTGLLNRESFSEHLKQSVTKLERYGTPFTILYLDLDQFKAVNDSRGHLVGDKLLAAVSDRIKAALRVNDAAARLGGDEFAIVLNQNCDSWSAATLAARLVQDVTRPYEIDGETITIGLSIGIALAPLNGIRPDQLIRNADLALYRAKADGRGVYRFFEAKMDSEAREKRMLEVELREAIGEEQFVLHYQPLVSAADVQPIGFEALLRWNHPIRGAVQPSEFIPIAEQSGLIVAIGDWVIRKACLAAATWPDHLTVSVNLSAKHFECSDITVVIGEALAASQLNPQRLEIEITEGLLIKNPDEVVAKLREIKALGVTVAIDDFGTGYSSLLSLLKFPFDKIKIDRSFVAASSEGAAARDVLRMIAALGKTLKMRITAEGVETQEQVEFLREIGCHSFQGYLFAKPLDQIELAGYLLSKAEDVFEVSYGAVAKRRRAV